MRRQITTVFLTLCMVLGLLAGTAAAETTYTFEISGSEDYTYAYEVLELVNQHRQNNGLSALTMDEELLEAAMLRAAEMAIYFSHTRPDNTLCWSAFPSGHYGRAEIAENIAAGQSDPDEVMDSWRNSSGHNANMLTSSFNAIGIGCFEHNGMYGWVQIFSSRNGTEESTQSSGSRDVTVEIVAAESLLALTDIRPSETVSLAGSDVTQTYTLIHTNPGWSYISARISPTFAETDDSSIAKAALSGEQVKLTPVSDGTTDLLLGLAADSGSSADALVFSIPVEVRMSAPAHQHVWTSEWSYDDDYHWHECENPSDCDAVRNDAKDGYAAHSLKWLSDNHSHWRGCSVCPYQSDYVQPHEYSNAADTDCNSCGYTRTACSHSYHVAYDGYEHWQECSLCGDKKDYMSHDYSESSFDSDYHWEACSCGKIVNKIIHQYDNAQDADCNSCDYSRTIEKQTWKITVAGTENGRVTVPVSTAAAGERITLTVTPDAGYELEALAITDTNGNQVTAVGNRFNMPTSDVTVTARFKKTEVPATEYRITVTGMENGLVMASADISREGYGVLLTIKPDAGYELDWLTVADEAGKQVEVTDHHFIMPGSDVTIAARFKEATAPAAEKHRITVTDAKNGKVTASADDAKEGVKITLTVAPDTGYTLEELTVTDEKGHAVVLRNVTEGRTYTFSMPAADVEITADFSRESAGVSQKDTEKDEENRKPVKEEEKTDQEEERPDREEQPDRGSDFWDVNENDWFYGAVHVVYQAGLMNGTTESSFSPDGTLTRSMVAQILYNAEGRPGAYTSAGFSDVNAGDWYASAVNWAAENGIVSGYGSSFGSNDAVTREQLCTILYRYAKIKGRNTSASTSLGIYSDSVQVSSYALEAMSWAAGEGIITGTSRTALSPQGYATRAQAASMLMRFFGL